MSTSIRSYFTKPFTSGLINTRLVAPTSPFDTASDRARYLASPTGQLVNCPSNCVPNAFASRTFGQHQFRENSGWSSEKTSCIPADLKGAWPARKLCRVKLYAGRASKQDLPASLLNRRFQADKPLYRTVTDVMFLLYFENGQWHWGTYR